MQRRSLGGQSSDPTVRVALVMKNDLWLSEVSRGAETLNCGVDLWRVMRGNRLRPQTGPTLRNSSLQANHERRPHPNREPRTDVNKQPCDRRKDHRNGEEARYTSNLHRVADTKHPILWSRHR